MGIKAQNHFCRKNSREAQSPFRNTGHIYMFMIGLQNKTTQLKKKISLIFEQGGGKIFG